MAKLRGALSRGFGAAIQAARTRARLTQEGLAHAAGVHPTYISQVERGLLSPTVDKVEALARALGIRPSSLIRAAEGNAKGLNPTSDKARR